MSQNTPTALVAGNWKMNGLKASIAELDALIKAVSNNTDADCNVLICPPFPLIAAFADASYGTKIAIGAQDCHANKSGAHTGDTSAEMLKDAGVSYIIVGHSERRADHLESDADVRAKAEAVLAQGVTVIICVGETEAERDAGEAVNVVKRQLAGSIPDNATSATTIIAYEPVWAIGTGRTPTVADVEEIHTATRNALKARFGEDASAMAILYGGSVKPSNAAELMGAANVNGALVGGASLKAADFDGIIAAYR